MRLYGDHTVRMARPITKACVYNFSSDGCFVSWELQELPLTDRLEERRALLLDVFSIDRRLLSLLTVILLLSSLIVSSKG